MNRLKFLILIIWTIIGYTVIWPLIYLVDGIIKGLIKMYREIFNTYKLRKDMAIFLSTLQSRWDSLIAGRGVRNTTTREWQNWLKFNN